MTFEGNGMLCLFVLYEIHLGEALPGYGGVGIRSLRVIDGAGGESGDQDRRSFSGAKFIYLNIGHHEPSKIDHI